MISRRAFSLLLSLFVAFSTCIFVQGQSTYGSITGSVTDPSGAAIGDARVTLTNLGTAEKRIQPTGSDGLYSFVNLIPGNYRIEVEKQGFKRITQEPVVVQVQQTSKIDVALPIGQATETVEVTSETPLLQSETSSLGQVVEQRKANELPLNGRNIYSLAAVAPSVVPQGSTTGSPVGKNPFDFANYQIGGSFANQSAEYLDGQPLNIGYINLPLLTPTQDSVSEFKVQYNNLGPEWGKFSGGVINLSTKSGTNKWHGSAYEYLRNKVFNSNEYFLKGSQIANGLKNEPPPFTQNQYGATFGGPAIKDKTFFFFSWEAYRLRSGTLFYDHRSHCRRTRRVTFPPPACRRICRSALGRLRQALRRSPPHNVRTRVCGQRHPGTTASIPLRRSCSDLFRCRPTPLPRPVPSISSRQPAPAATWMSMSPASTKTSTPATVYSGASPTGSC